MNDAERIDALIKGGKPDKVPIFAFGGNGFAMVSNHYPIVTIYNDFSTTLKKYRETALRYGWLYTPYLAYASMGAWEMGGEIKWPDGEFSQAPSVAKHPVTSPEEAFELDVPDPPLTGMVPRQIEFYKKVLSEPDDIKPWKLLCQIEGVFTFASNIAGASTFSRWLIKSPEAAHQLLSKTVTFLERLAQQIKTLFGTDGVVLFGGEPGSSNQLISPKMFEKFALPHTLELHHRLLDMGFTCMFKHICGEQNLNLPYWQKIPMGNPGLVSFGHEVDLERASECFPDDIIVGNLNPSLIQSGSSEEVYEASRTIIEQGKRLENGFVFAPGCALPPKSPPENIMAMKRAVDDFGWY
jgi:uroporphyrinogen decarboxylase